MRTTSTTESAFPPTVVDNLNTDVLSLCRDSRTLRNREELEIKERRKEESNEESSAISDPTAPARSHGNKPSRGAEIDAELQRDDELRLQEKGIKQ